MDEQLRIAIEGVLEYLEDVEFHDYMMQDDEGRQGHVYNHLSYLRERLNDER